MSAALLSGCASSGKQVTDAQAGQFEQGKATQQDVVAKLGPPSMISGVAPDGSHSIAYSYSRAEMRAASFIPYVNYVAGGTDTTTTVVRFSFDANDHLTGWTSTGHENSMNNGPVNR
jgi:YD repeat-containing protein